MRRTRWRYADAGKVEEEYLIPNHAIGDDSNESAIIDHRKKTLRCKRLLEEREEREKAEPERDDSLRPGTQRRCKRRAWDDSLMSSSFTVQRLRDAAEIMGTN
ncbi:hypothetical protein NL676_034762 [Syzygium grande]|nr:hypothetical protein NL676_034762 [Syzygium grande]